MDENYWKESYKNTWEESSQREERFKTIIEATTGYKLHESGLGAGSSKFIPGSAAQNGYQKGDADFTVDGTNIFIEVTGPLVKTVPPSAPLWFRPDKIDNAINNCNHDVFFVHHCMGKDLWRVIHVDQEFKKRYSEKQFPIISTLIRGRTERYVEIKANDNCINNIDFLINYIKNS